MPEKVVELPSADRASEDAIRIFETMVELNALLTAKVATICERAAYRRLQTTLDETKAAAQKLA